MSGPRALPFDFIGCGALHTPHRPNLRRTSQPRLAVEQTATKPTAVPAGNPWLNLWYPVTFAASVTNGSLVPATIWERPLVLWRDHEDQIRCLKDECPHRLAPLSDGRIATDASGATRLECSYHGWQFSGCGACTHLPQLESSKPILPQYAGRRHVVPGRGGPLRLTSL